MDIAQAMETADRDAHHLQNTQKQTAAEDAAAHVRVVQTTRKPQDVRKTRPSIQCYRCGGKHKPLECKFKEAECYACGKVTSLGPVEANPRTVDMCTDLMT